MGTYHQMGHQSTNLVEATDLRNFAGAILSPVNDTPVGIKKFMERFGRRGEFEYILDPQLYWPHSDKPTLKQWKYFPSDFASVDHTIASGWHDVITSLGAAARDLGVDAVCSPARVPRVYELDHHTLSTEIADLMVHEMKGSGIEVLQTALVDFASLANYNRVLEIGSILTTSKAKRFYLVFHSDHKNPRRELESISEIKGAMLLISLLRDHHFDVLVAFSCSDILLWKTAGATACATGKFWNLRRFNPARWSEESEGGGGQVAYLFEEGLVGFIRDNDIPLLEFARSDATKNNPYLSQILPLVASAKPWLSIAWKQFLYWFCEIDTRLTHGATTASALLKIAEEHWDTIDDDGLLLEEKRNKGDWVRPWRIAIADYKKPW
jgi:hypothetical protein